MKKFISKKLILAAIFFFLLLDVFLIINYLRNGIGYQPIQNVSFSHKLHSKYKISCLFCHHKAETNNYANLPTTKTCMICHIALKTESSLLKNVLYSYDSLISLRYIKINDLPDYVRFNHSLHIRSGIDCATCHGFVDEMDSTYQAKNFTMGWCVDCHNKPEKYLIKPREISGIFYFNDTTLFEKLILSDPVKFVKIHSTNLTFTIPQKIKPASTNCSICHE